MKRLDPNAMIGRRIKILRRQCNTNKQETDRHARCPESFGRHLLYYSREGQRVRLGDHIVET